MNYSCKQLVALLIAMFATPASAGLMTVLNTLDQGIEVEFEATDAQGSRLEIIHVGPQQEQRIRCGDITWPEKYRLMFRGVSLKRGNRDIEIMPSALSIPFTINDNFELIVRPGRLNYILRHPYGYVPQQPSMIKGIPT